MRTGLLVGLLLASMLLTGCLAYYRFQTAEVRPAMPAEEKPMPSEDLYPDGPTAPPIVPACEGIDDLLVKDTCYREMAHERGDSRLCARISSNAEKGDCYLALARETATGDAELCKEIDGLQRDKCYLDAGVKTKDRNLCTAIDDYALKQSCYAIVATDPRLCDSIDDAVVRGECYRLCEEGA